MHSAGHSGMPFGCTLVPGLGALDQSAPAFWWSHCKVLGGFDGKGTSKLPTICFYLQAQELGEEEKDQSKASIDEEQSKRTKAAARYGTNRTRKEA